MRKIILTAFMLCSVILCGALNSLSMGATDVYTDELAVLGSLINDQNPVFGISEETLDTEDPYYLGSLNGWGSDPAISLGINKQKNSFDSSAEQSKFLGNDLVITDWGVSLQGSVLNKIINKASYKQNTVTITPGTGKAIQADLTAINQIVSNSKVQASFLAVRLSDGATIGYNADDYYQSCSTIKAPLALYVSKLVSENKLDWNSPVSYTLADYISGTGLIKNYSYGTKFKIKTLIEYSIKESDNVAHNMLARSVGISGFYNMMDNMNAKLNSDESSYWPQSNARSMALYWNEIYSFSQNNSTGKWLWDTFGATYSKIGTALGKTVPVYSKTGSSSTCSHEGAVVMGDVPYIIIILTRSTSGTNTDSYFFNLAREIDKVITG